MSAPTSADIEKIIETTDRLERDIAFVNSLVMAPQLIQGTRYKYVFNNEIIVTEG